MTTFGIDYAFGRPSVAALKAAGVKFVARYLSHSPTKNLTAAEAHALTNAGIWIVVVWETTAQRALDGRTAGVADALDAQVQAQACGMPAGRPVFFAVDWDASAGQQAAINAYLDGAASVLGKNRVGIYGGYGPVKRALDGGHAKWAWQTYAWSGGQWDGRAQLQQYSNNHSIGGVGCDYNRATASDYGQWRIGASPDPTPQPQQEEDEMIARDVLEGMDKKTEFPLKPGACSTVTAFADNSYTDGKLIKATAPVKLRIVVLHRDGSWQHEEIVVGRKATEDATHCFKDFPISDPAHAVGVSVTRMDGDGTEPLTVGAY